MLATIALTVDLYIKTPKGYFPQDDTGLIFGSTAGLARHFVQDDGRAAAAGARHRRWRIRRSRASARRSAARASSASVNQGRMFISLKPLAERGGVTTARVVDRLRRKLDGIAGIRLFMVPAQDMRVGGGAAERSQYQFTLWSPDLDELQNWVPQGAGAHARQFRASPTSPPTASRAACRSTSSIDRPARGAARRAHPGHRQRAEQRLRAAADLDDLHAAQPVQRHPGGRSAASSATPTISRSSMCRAAAARRCRCRPWRASSATLAPLVVNHQGQFPSVTITFNLRPDMPLEAATQGRSSRRSPSCTCRI